MDLYLDSAYVAKCYLNEKDSAGVRAIVREAERLYSSTWCIAEIACTLHRQIREQTLTTPEAVRVWDEFRKHITFGGWNLISLTERVLLQVGAILEDMPPGVFVRAGDAIHLVTARDAGFSEIWTNDRHVLRAAPHFGLAGKSV